MTTKFSTVVTLMNGEKLTFKDDQIMTFEMQDRGLFFVHSSVEKNLSTLGNKVNKIHYRYVRSWIPYQQIKEVEIITNKETVDPAEIDKYQKFLKHGIDIMMTQVSYTAPKTAQQVEEELAKEAGKQPDKKPEGEKPSETPVVKSPEPKPAEQ